MTDKRNNKMPWLWAWWELVFIAGKYLELKQMFYERPVGLPGSDISLAAANLFLNPPLKPQCTAHVSVIWSENIQDVLLTSDPLLHVLSEVCCMHVCFLHWGGLGQVTHAEAYCGVWRRNSCTWLLWTQLQFCHMLTEIECHSLIDPWYSSWRCFSCELFPLAMHSLRC